MAKKKKNKKLKKKDLKKASGAGFDITKAGLDPYNFGDSGPMSLK